jgi:aspartyl-tRNA(Asn)/glutamyl-tRNA(Gln) amidotransferase subunit C
MITVKEIENLANLARIKLDESEKQSLTKEIDSILNYIDEIKKATVNMDYEPAVGSVSNVYREDISNSISPESREALLNEAPDREGDFIAVKKIIDQEQFDL